MRSVGQRGRPARELTAAQLPILTRRKHPRDQTAKLLEIHRRRCFTRSRALARRELPDDWELESGADLMLGQRLDLGRKDVRTIGRLDLLDDERVRDQRPPP